MIVGYFLLVLCIMLQGIPYLVHKSPLLAKLFLVCGFGELWLLATFRTPTFVTDDMGYLEMFYAPSLCYTEWGYCWLNNFIRMFGTEQYILFAVLAFLLFASMAVFIYRYSDNVVVSVLTYICLMYAFNALNGVRQFLAISVIFLAFPLVQKKRFWLFLGAVCLACLFHKSAIICLSFYWLYNNVKVNVKNISIIVVVILIMCLVFDQLSGLYTSLGGGYAGYLTPDAEQGRLSSIIRLLVNSSIALFALLISKENNQSGIAPKISIDFLTLCSCISATGALISLQAYNMERIVYYFYIFNIITLPNIILRLKNKLLGAGIMTMAVVLVVLYGVTVIWSWEKQGKMLTFLWS